MARAGPSAARKFLFVPWNEVSAMFPRARIGLLFLASLSLLAFGLASLRGGDAPKNDHPAAADKEKIDSNAAVPPTASGIKFRKELGLPLNTLNTLGARIDAARKAHDPVALANTAQELSTAEKVSGKKASLLSTELMKESAQLAAM